MFRINFDEMDGPTVLFHIRGNPAVKNALNVPAYQSRMTPTDGEINKILLFVPSSGNKLAALVLNLTD